SGQYTSRTLRADRSCGASRAGVQLGCGLCVIVLVPSEATTFRSSRFHFHTYLLGWFGVFFFFQAEDGIRDWSVTGVQTCALPIFGLVPAALQGLDVDGLLAGAAECDAVTRQPDWRRNPAALMALMWHYATGGQGKKIGRAACRGKEGRPVGGAEREKKEEKR